MPAEKGVRVRGVYSTALARLLIDHGIGVVDASPQLKQRFGDSVSERGTALATVKDREDGRGLVVVGSRDLVERVITALRSELRASPILVAPAELYATYVCRAREGGVVELPGRTLGVLEGGAREGELVVAHVFAFRKLTPLLRRGATIVGEYARLVERRYHEVSEHIRGERRELLFSLAARAGVGGWGIKWRSSAKWATFEELLSELSRLREVASRVKSALRRIGEPTKLTEGEALVFMPLAFEDKLRLDEVRSRQVPTIPCHHLFKACGGRYTELVDALEVPSTCCPLSYTSRELLRRVEGDLAGTSLRVLHEKINGEVILISGRAKVVAENPLTLQLERAIAGSGSYDGLEVLREQGDVAVSVVALWSRVLPHAYFSKSGELKGVYVNVNTPIEPCPPDSVWYLDLCADVVWTREGGVRLVDLEELKSLAGAFAEEALKWYSALAMEVADALRKLEGKLMVDAVGVLKELAATFSIPDPCAAT